MVFLVSGCDLVICQRHLLENVVSVFPPCFIIKSRWAIVISPSSERFDTVLENLFSFGGQTLKTSVVKHVGEITRGQVHLKNAIKWKVVGQLVVEDVGTNYCSAKRSQNGFREKDAIVADLRTVCATWVPSVSTAFGI